MVMVVLPWTFFPPREAVTVIVTEPVAVPAVKVTGFPVGELRTPKALDKVQTKVAPCGHEPPVQLVVAESCTTPFGATWGPDGEMETDERMCVELAVMEIGALEDLDTVPRVPVTVRVSWPAVVATNFTAVPVVLLRLPRALLLNVQAYDTPDGQPPKEHAALTVKLALPPTAMDVVRGEIVTEERVLVLLTVKLTGTVVPAPSSVADPVEGLARYPVGGFTV